MAQVGTVARWEVKTLSRRQWVTQLGRNTGSGTSAPNTPHIPGRQGSPR